MNYMLEGFEKVEAIEPRVQPPTKPSNTLYYVRVQFAPDQPWYYLWKTHSNGGPVWMFESNKRSKPLRYKSLSGAQQSLKRNHPILCYQTEVAVWHE